MMPDFNAGWAGVLSTTTQEYMLGKQSLLDRNRQWFAMFRQRGRILYNQSGLFLDWKVENREHRLNPFGFGSTLVFPQQNRYVTAQIGWKGYSVTDSMTRMEQLINRGTAQIIDTYAEKPKNLVDDMERLFSDEIYIDGSLAQNIRRFDGVPTFTGYIIDPTLGAARPNMLPVSSYAGLSCALGAGGGSWTGTWPVGKGDTQYDYWSPLITNYKSTHFSTEQTWEAACNKAVKWHLLYMTKNNKDAAHQVDYLSMDTEMYYTWLNKLEAQERIVTERNAANSLLIRTGFGNVTNYMGADITFEYGVPPDEAFSFAFDASDLRFLTPQMWEQQGPDWEISSQTYRWAVVMLGNFKSTPRRYGRLVGQAA